MPRVQAADEAMRYKEAQDLRSTHENDWRLAALHCVPRHISAWQTDGHPGLAGSGAATARRTVYDNTGMRSLPKYTAILERMVTPQGQKWHKLSASSAELMKVHSVRGYFQNLTDLLFRMRYNPNARFKGATSEMYTSIGVYGMGPLALTKRKLKHIDDVPGFMYKACHMRDIYVLLNDEGVVDTVFRRFFLNVRQYKIKFGNDAPIPKCMTAEAKKATPSENTYFEFVQVCKPRDDYDPQALDVRRHLISSSYFSAKDPEYVGEEEGFRSLPILTPRTFTEAGDAYGWSPAMQAIASMGGASATKKTAIKQGQKAADPVLLTHDDGVLNGEVDLRPGHVNPGGVNKDGKPLVTVLPTGNFNVSENLLADDRRDTEDSFFVTLFQILTDNPQMTATEVVERVAEKASLLAPTMGRLQSEFAGPDIEREIDLLMELGLLPEMPPELIEAQGDYEVVYTSALAKGLYAEEISGFLRSVEMGINVATATGDPSHLDHFNFDVAIPEISDKTAVPDRWISTPDEVEGKREQRSQQQQQEQLLANLPAVTGAAKVAQQADAQGAE